MLNLTNFIILNHIIFIIIYTYTSLQNEKFLLNMNTVKVINESSTSIKPYRLNSLC